MKSTFQFAALAALLPLSVGCTTTTDTVRGQSPDMVVPQYYPESPAGPFSPASFQSMPVNMAMPASMAMTGTPAIPMAMASCQSGHCPTPTTYAVQCPQCQTPQHGHCGGCCSNCNLPFHPVHRNFYTFQQPQGLRYPQQNTPAAVYQYPYYTLRGPTDFFMDKPGITK